VRALNKLSASSHKNFENKLKEMNIRIHKAVKASKNVNESAGLASQVQAIISEVQDMYVYLQTKLQSSSKKKSYETVLENYYSTLRKLTEQKMTKKNKRNLAEDLKLSLNIPLEDEDLEAALQDALNSTEIVVGEEEGEEEEAPGGEEEEELDLGGEEESDEGEDEDEDLEEEGVMRMEGSRLSDNLVVEIDEGMLRREIARMKALREEKETKAQSWGHGAGEVADGFEDEDMGDPLLDIELTTEGADEAEEAALDEDEMLDEDDLTEQDVVQSYMAQQQAKQGQGMAPDTTDAGGEVGSDEDEEKALDEEDGMLDEEEAGMDQSRDPKSKGGTYAPSPDPEQSQEGNPRTTESLRREARIQTEARKKATMAKKLQVEAAKRGNAKKANQFAAAYKFFATKFNESVTRTNKIKGMLAEAARKGRTVNGRSTQSAAEANNLRAKLAETNLFNAKLLFTNKLLQNESLTKRQKAEVIERLDEAKTEREVKLVYESVTKSLQGSTARRMAESTDRGVIGSASRPARPASTNLNEGFEADRWARLAGITK
jgi:hypothetical protein